MSQQPRVLSDTEFVDLFHAVVRRLDKHVFAVADGDYDARDDIATVMRTLFAHGKGNDAVLRLCRRFHLDEPERIVSPPIQPTDGVILGIGVMPAKEVSEVLKVSVPSSLMCMSPLIVAVSDRKTKQYTWDNVIEDYGNALGAHLGTMVPGILDDICFYGVGETDFGTYMLWSIGRLASSVCHELLTRLDSNHKSVHHSEYLQGLAIYEILYLRQNGQDKLSAKIRKENWRQEGRVMSVRDPEGNQLIFSIADGGKLRLTIRCRCYT